MRKKFLRKRIELARKEQELQDYEKRILKMLDECLETIEECKKYLNLCGISNEEIENLLVRSKLNVIRRNNKH